MCQQPPPSTVLQIHDDVHQCPSLLSLARNQAGHAVSHPVTHTARSITVDVDLQQHQCTEWNSYRVDESVGVLPEVNRKDSVNIVR